MQVVAQNFINVPGLNITYADLETLVLTEKSKAALRAASYKHAAEVPFATWSTGVETPVGALDNSVPFDRDGNVRSAEGDLPGAWV
jgi:hypothetical protein